MFLLDPPIERLSPLELSTLSHLPINLTSFFSKLIESIFKGLEIECNYANDRWTCIVPTFRPDIEHEIDLIEEIARIYGYHNIPSDTKIYGSFRYEHPDPEAVYEPIRETLVSCGFNHIYANSLQSEKEAKNRVLVGNRRLLRAKTLTLMPSSNYSRENSHQRPSVIRRNMTQNMSPALNV